jgi:osmotically-inducible protein OsmY
MRTALPLLVGMAVSALLLSEASAQQGTAEKIGQRVDEGLEKLTEGIQQAWRDVRKTVDQLGVQGRVYGRLRWDKALADAEIDVDIQEPNTIILTGGVPDDAARAKAVQLAHDTVGVQQVIDRLQLELPSTEPNTPAPTQPPTSNTPDP